MAKKNIISEKMEAVKKWWDSDTTKAISTIIAVLLIPGAVLAWNYASGRNVKVEDSILEGDSTSVEPNVEESQPTEEKTDLEIGGINEVTTLPSTSSSFE